MKQHYRKLLAFLACMLVAGFTANADPDPNFHIYICWGQSNMEGNATVPESELSGVSDRFKLLYSASDCTKEGCGRKLGKWFTATPPLARCFHWNNSGFGPVDYFGRTLVAKLDPSIRVGVIVVACGGACIDLFEPANYANYLATCENWLKGYAESYGGNPYKRIIDLAKQAQQEGVIKGILVHQGESNNGQSDWPSRLNGVYQNMLKDLNLKASDVPLLVGEVRYTGPCSGHNNTIKNVPSVIPTAHIVSAEGCEASNDQFHFSVNGYKLLGERYAETMLKILGDNPVQKSGITISTIVNSESEPGEVEIQANVENEDIKRVDIYADNKVIASGATSYIWTNVDRGSHTVWAVGYDSNNKEYVTSKTEIVIFEPQLPFNGSPAKIPGRIEAEEYDFGGEGNAYHDVDDVNEGKGPRNDGVDAKANAVGYNEKGEWLEYTIEIEEEGEYVVESRVTSDNASSGFTLYLDNKFIIPGDDGTPGGFVKIPNTGGYNDDNFTIVKTNLNRLTKGVHVLKLEVTGDWFDIDYLEFTNTSSGVPVNYSIKDLPNGEYAVFNANGAFLNNLSVENGVVDLLPGVYVLKNIETNASRKVVVPNK